MNEWIESTLDEEYEFTSGLSKSRDQFGYGFGFVSFKDVFYNYFLPNELGELANTSLKEQESCSVKRGDVFLTRTSETFNELGMSSVALKDYERATFNGFTKRLRPKQNSKIWPEYIGYYFRSSFFRSLVTSMATMTTRASLNNEILSKLKVKYPPLPEQKAIAHILGALDAKIDLNRKMNQTLEAMAHALFKSWFVDFDPVMDNALAEGNAIPDELQAMAEKRSLVSDSKKLLSKNPELAAKFPSTFVFHERLGKWIPEGWEVKSFGDLIETTIGGDWGKEVSDDKHTEEVKIIRGTDIPSLANCDLESAPTRFVELKKLKTRKLKVGDIVIEVSGGSPSQSTGRSIRLTKNILERLGNIAEPASFCRRLKPINEHFSVLCGEHLTYIYGIGKMWEYQNQSTGIANFQTPYFLEAELVLVPSDEKVLDSFYSQVSKLKDKATSNENIILTQLRDRLLPELISGRVRITNYKQKKDEKTLQQNYF